MKRLRVVRVYKAVKSGGGVHARLRELLPRLARHCDVRVLCYRERGDRAAELEAAGIPVDVVASGSKWAPWNLGRYVDYFRRLRPDVVHCHEYTANTLVLTAAARAGVPARVRHLHTLAPWGWGGGLRTALRVAADRRAARRAQATLAVSEAVRRLYLERTGLPPASCRVLYNGVDVARFGRRATAPEAVRAAWGLPPGAPVVGLVGRLARGKGHDAFLDAALGIAQGRPDARFLVVGGGGLLGELRARAAELGLGDRVVFTGPREDVPDLLGAMDVFLFPSGPDEAGRIQDGLPGVVIEAQAASLPVVAFALPMMEELVEDGVSGRLVAVGDAAGAAAACLGYLTDPQARRRAGEAAAAGAARFSLEECERRTRMLYEELAEGREAGA